MRTFFNLLIILMPWKLKRFLLVNVYKYKIHPSAHIGFSYIFPDYLEMGAKATIGHLNCAIHLNKIIMGEKSCIAQFNWITGFPLNTSSKHFSHQKDRMPVLILGKESAITKHHHIDCTDSVNIGKFTTIAGYGSQLLTHSINVYSCRQESESIVIGDYCFVSTGVKILGGAKLPAFSVLAAGAVLTKGYVDEWKIYAGVPAKPIKDIANTAQYFSRERGFVY